MKDKAFLQWVHDRLANVWDENTLTDYMRKLRAIIAATPDDVDTKEESKDDNT